MYYTVRDRAHRVQSISVATSAGPAGPFTDSSSGPLICQLERGGSIDPDPYLDPVTHDRYLLWKSEENSLGRPTRIWAQQLGSDGLSLAPGTSPSLVLGQSAAWQWPALEGPALTRHDGLYYLFYAILAIIAGSAIVAIGGSGIGPLRRVWDRASR